MIKKLLLGFLITFLAINANGGITVTNSNTIIWTGTNIYNNVNLYNNTNTVTFSTNFPIDGQAITNVNAELLQGLSVNAFVGTNSFINVSNRVVTLEGQTNSYALNIITNDINSKVSTNGGIINGSLTITSNLIVQGAFSTTNIDSSHPVYQLSYDIGNTCTITRAMGSHLGIQLTTNIIFTIDWTTFPTNQYASFSMCINPMNYAATWDGGLTNTLSLVTSNWSTIIFVKGCYWSKFLGTGKVAP